MKVDVRKTTPFTVEEDEQIRAFSRPDSWEHACLARFSTVPLRKGSDGSVVRALALLGMAYLREHGELALDLASGYEELAAERAEQGEIAHRAGMRENMARRGRPGSATKTR